MVGAKATKTTIRTCKLKNGQDKEVEVTTERIFDLRAKADAIK